MANFPLIVVGTYEEFVLGYTPKVSDEKNKYKLHQTFATHSHQASVRCVAANGQLMASSGADEYINVYDMTAMEVSTVINYHNSTVTCLEFTPDNSHLVSANQNGDIAIFRCKDWNLVKLWKEAHKHANGVTSTSIHPSGSLLMTTGADNIIRFWNLVKGRHAYATNYSKKCSVGNSLNFGIWSKDGSHYAVCIGNKVEIYKTETAAVEYEFNTSSRATCVVFTKKNLLCIGSDEGVLEVHSIPDKKLLCKEQAHKTRLKCVAYFSTNLIKNEKNKMENYIVTGESKGGIKLWYLKRKGENYSLELKGEVDCDCRITCITLVFPKDLKQEKDESESLNMTVTLDDTVPEVVENLNSSNKLNGVSNQKEKSKKRKRNLEIEDESNGSTTKIGKCLKSKNEENGKFVKKKKISKVDVAEKQVKSKSNLSKMKQFKKKKLKGTIK